MAARYFVDENDLALGRALGEVHSEVVYPGHPDLAEVPRGALDDEWLPVVASLRLVVITRDQRICNTGGRWLRVRRRCSLVGRCGVASNGCGCPS